MPRCRKCNKDWPATMTACPDDGWSFTVESDATYHPPVTGAPRPATPAPRRSMTPAPVPGSPTMGTAQHAVAEPELPPSQDLEPGDVVGEYRIDRKIGEGGMGAVYAAVHPLIGKKAAIKVISSALGTDASAVQRFVQEARSVNQIGHPNIVDVFAFGMLPDGRNYFVMEHLQGEGLANRLERVSMPLGEAIEILDQVADALEAAHEQQIVHRDLKPDNVYLAAVRGGRMMVKLLDFGIAKLSSDTSGTGGVAKTRTGIMMGTPGYLSPEQARGKNVDHRTDIYALGCMTFEIACGRLPFVADNAMDIVLAHMTAQPPRPSEVWPEIPPPLEELILRMLSKNPEERPSLPEIRATFAELVTSGLVTLDANRPATFGSGLGGRIATPARGIPTPPPGGMPAVGTAPPIHRLQTAPGTAATSPPIAGEIVPGAKKKSGLLLGVIAGVVLIGGGAAFVVMRGDASSTPAARPVEPTRPPAPPPEPAKPVAAPVVAPAKPEVPAPKRGVIDITVDVDKAQIMVDDVVHGSNGRAKVTLDEGVHTIAITAEGYTPWELKRSVDADETVPLDVKLEKVAAPIAKRPQHGAKPPAVSGAKPGTASKPPAAGSGAHRPDDAPIDPF